MSAAASFDRFESPVMPAPVSARSQGPWKVRAVSRPATEFTGDFYFTADSGPGFWFALGDFAGHGLRAAVFMAMIQEQLEFLIQACESADPAEVVASLDEVLRAEFPLNRFATMVLGRGTADGSVQLVNAGHCPPIIARADGKLETIPSHGPIVGRAPAPQWKQQILQLGPGDRLILYTDGLVEAESSDGEELGYDCFADLLQSTAPDAPLESVLNAVRRLSGGPQVDDMTLCVVEHLS
jgi:sigma-B regulation protein RsbU (phosphoserine phosphatase)